MRAFSPLALSLALLSGAPVAASADGSLVDAVRDGNRAAVRALMDKRVNVNTPDVDGTTPLHWAAHRNDVETAAMLVRAGANVNAANRYGVRPLSLACVNGNAAVVEMLLTAGADANAPIAEGETPLMTAARTGSMPAVRLLLARGADVSQRESWRGQNALMWAAAEGHVDVARALIERGADVRARSKGGLTALLFAAREGRINTVKVLLDAGATLDEATETRRPADTTDKAAVPEPGLNAFLLAVANAHYELAALLLDRGADPNAAPRGWTALHQLSWVRKTGIAGSNDPAPEGSGKMDSLEFVRVLVAHGADVNARVSKRPPAGMTRLNMIGGTPFLLAARTADAEYMRVLAELGADPLASNVDKTTPLMVAAGLGTLAPGEDPGTEPEVLDAVKLALQLGGDLNGVDGNGDTVMHAAASKHVPSVVRFLAEAGARIDVWNQKDKEGYTPLEITQGVKRSMNIIRSAATEEAIREVMRRAGVSTGTRP